MAHSKKYVSGFQNIILRFPLAIVLLLVMTIDSLATQDFLFGNQALQLTLGITTILAVIAELAYERFYYSNQTKRLLLYVVSIALGLIYYLYLFFSVGSDPNWPLYSIPGIRSMIIVFTLLIALIWVPSIKGRVTFEESFLAVFKAFFISIFFSVVLFVGISLTFLLFEMLIATPGDNWLVYVSILVFNFFWPTFFLSLLPDYREKNLASHVFETPKLLSHLISWILIPLMIVYSLIILLYILTNMSGDFFNDSLLEPLLLSYAISGWILLILAAGVNRPIVTGFKRIFPPLLLIVIVFQMIASTIQMLDIGITHGRYLILLFGVASLISGGYYIIKRQDLKWFTLVAVISGIIAFVPPVDALSVSVSNQVNRLEALVERNNMLEGETVVHQDNVPEEDQKAILASAGYLLEISALDKVDFMPDDFQNSSDFNLYTFFGIDPSVGERDYGMPMRQNPSWLTLSNQRGGVPIIPLEDYDHLIPLYVSSDTRQSTVTVTDPDATYKVTIDESLLLVIENESEELIEELNFAYILDQWDLGTQEELSLSEATFEEVGERFKVKIIIQELSQYAPDDYYTEIYLMIGQVE